MSPAELYEIYYVAQESIDRLLQFLISISFAVVIASYLASNRLPGFFFAVMGLIFTLVYVVLALRMNVAIEKVIEFQARLVEGRGLPGVPVARSGIGHYRHPDLLQLDQLPDLLGA